LKNSLYARFDLRSGTKLAVFGAFQARFVVAVSSMPTFSTGSQAEETDTVKVPRAFVERLTDVVCYAA